MKYDTLADSPGWLDIINEIHSTAWPVFLSEDKVVKKYWRKLYDLFPEYQLVFTEGEQTIGLANCFPIHWSGEIPDLPAGLDHSLEIIIENRNNPNTLLAGAVVVRKEFSRRGFSSKILEVIKNTGTEKGFSNLIVPVRPVLKTEYPKVPMEDYMLRKKGQLPFDPWLRVHVMSGGTILKVAYPSMTVTGSVAEWEEWTGLKFSHSSKYTIPGALSPVRIDLENDTGEYIESNVWVAYQL